MLHLPMAENATANLPTSLHRLPTLSASEALENTRSGDLGSITFGLKGLDLQLQGRIEGDGESIGSGLPSGQLTEVYGPPGIGKTTLCMQAAAAALSSGSRVLWIDTATRIAGPRLKEILSDYKVISDDPLVTGPSRESSVDEKLSLFSHYSAPTLPHLLALLLHPPRSFPPGDTGLIVVDSVSTLIDTSYPRSSDDRPASARNDNTRWLAGRRQAVIVEIGSKLAKLAAMRNIPILLTSNTVTKIRAGTDALLRPAIYGQEWDSAIGARVVLFRDWLTPKARSDSLCAERSARFAGVVKLGTGSAGRDLNKVVAFSIDQAGLNEVITVTAPASLRPNVETSMHVSKKRPHNEIVDSEAEISENEYGWDEDHDQLVAEGLVDASF